MVEYDEACRVLRANGWIVEIFGPSLSGINHSTVWRKGNVRIVTVWYPGDGQWEVFLSTPMTIEDAMIHVSENR